MIGIAKRYRTAPNHVPVAVMLQAWTSLTFLHWPYPPQELQRWIPKSLSLDLFDNKAWLGLTPFMLKDLRPPFMPALPFISRFPETNVRTYVIGPDGEPGIWFFNLEADRALAVLGARALFSLPYRWASMQIYQAGQVIEYRSRRHGRPPEVFSRITTCIQEQLVPGELDNFLTSRFRLYTVRAGRLEFADIEHKPWPLRHAEVTKLDQNLIESLGIPSPAGHPLVHYSPGVNVRIGACQATCLASPDI